MKVKLADLELPQVQEVAVYERRSLAEHKPPGMAGSLLQNLGRHPAAIFLWGVVTGPKALEFIEKLESKFRAAAPAPFTAEIISGAGVSQVLVAGLRVQDLAGKPERFAYALSLREFIKPSKAADHAALNAGIRSEARGLVRNQAAKLTKRK
jgi:hypothetical protein